MAITAAFTADVTNGKAALTVTFTDASSGSPTNWLWDFGDGATSKDQNPVHTYNIAGNFTVKLRAFISTGETISNGTRSNELQRTGVAGSNAAAHAALLAASFGATSVVGRYVVRNIAGTYTYRQGKSTLGLDLTAFTSHVIEFRIPFDPIQSAENGVRFIESGMILPSSATPFTDLFVEDVTAFAGSNITRTFEVSNGGESAPAILTAPNSPNQHGWGLASNARIYRHTFAAGNNDLETKTDYITVLPSEGFTVSTPRFGIDSFDVTFDENVPNNPTAFSWKRRPSGIQDPYVEFSTAENPTETFDVTDPTP